MTFAMSTGMALEQLLDPDSGAAELHGRMFAIFFAGLATVQGQSAG